MVLDDYALFFHTLISTRPFFHSSLTLETQSFAINYYTTILISTHIFSLIRIVHVRIFMGKTRGIEEINFIIKLKLYNSI